MKEGKVTLLCLFMFLMITSLSFGQNTVYSTIAKNINSEANSLQHNLNKAGDTLHLSSDYNLYKVEFIGNYESKVFEVERGKKKASIPLASVPVGEYTIAAFQIERSDAIYQYQKTIVFRISRLLPIETPLLEEELIAEVVPDSEPEDLQEKETLKPTIKKEEPIVKKEEALVAEVTEQTKKEPLVKEKKEAPITPKKETVKKERIKKHKAKKETVKKEKVKKEVTAKKKTRVATSTPKPVKKQIKPVKKVQEKSVVKTKPAKDTRVTETKKPSLDSTVYKSYNLTNARGGRYVVQSRAEYRAQNLRPNGEPYN